MRHERRNQHMQVTMEAQIVVQRVYNQHLARHEHIQQHEQVVVRHVEMEHMLHRVTQRSVRHVQHEVIVQEER